MGKRGSAHINVQRSGRERDNYTCQICGSRNHSEGHHIFDYSFGGAASLDNIVTLCRECHTKVHQGKIGLFKF